MMVPRLLFVNVQVTVSPALTCTLETELPSSQLAPVWIQPLGSASVTSYEPGATPL
jgi:hypothetical protein